MYKKVKRFADIIVSLLFIILLIPIFIIVPLIIILTMGSPALFMQKRVGLNNKKFYIYKFRTMRIKTDNKYLDSDRITFVGRILRVSRIDELPQLFNILLGDMSFIGPRPLLPEYLPYYRENELLRHDVRPGLSGLSQVSASYPGWEEQFEYDLKYIEEMNFKLDLSILIKTFFKVLSPSKKLTSGNAGRLRFDEHRKQQNQF